LKSERTNLFNQPIGAEIKNWKGALAPQRISISGRLCRIEPLDVQSHLDDLDKAFSLDPDGKLWTYMATGPFESKASFGTWLAKVSQTEDPLFHAIIDKLTGKAIGMAAYMRINPTAGSIEIGSISFSPALQKTALATEAMFLFMQRAFEELNYRRYEWKCDSLNAASIKAALRLGFSYEGEFRQALVYKGRNRNTRWFSILDSEWPYVKQGFVDWLEPANFDEHGQQLQKLQDFIKPQNS
jgi:RimJ/RimL family protein N-acetyltransferase